MNTIFIEPSDRIVNKIRNFVNNNGIKSTSMITKTRDANIRRYVKGIRSIPIEFLIPISLEVKENIWDLLDGEKLKSKSRHFKVSKEPSLEECRFIGWLLTDGHLPKDGFRVEIAQSKVEYLNKLKDDIRSCFDIRDGVEIVPDKNNWKLYIRISALRHYFNLRYAVLMGKKASIIRVPKVILGLSQSKQLAFIAGCIDGDGSLTYDTRKTSGKVYRVPKIIIASNSILFLQDMKKLLECNGTNSTINRDRDGYKLNISKVDDCIELFYKIYPYLIHKDKVEHFVGIISESRLLDILYVENSGAIIRTWKNKTGFTWEVFSDFLGKNLI